MMMILLVVTRFTFKRDGLYYTITLYMFLLIIFIYIVTLNIKFHIKTLL